MDEPRNKYKECLKGIWMVSVSPIAFLLFMLMALYNLLKFLCRVGLLFIIAAIHTPFAVMYNVSLLVFDYNRVRFNNRFCSRESNPALWDWSDPRASLGIEVKIIVSDFLKVVATEILLGVSTGIITYYTAPLKVFYVSTAFWLVAIVHQWFNKDCLSKTALSCLFDGYGLSPMMFLCSYIGFFDIGCHPVAKCSFVARKAFFFVRDVPNQFNKEVSQDVDYERNPNHQIVFIEEGPKQSNIEQGHSKLNEEGGQKIVQGPFLQPELRLMKMERPIEVNNIEQGDKELKGGRKVVQGSPPQEGHSKLNEEGGQKIVQGPFLQLEPYLMKMERPIDPIEIIVIEQGDKELKGGQKVVQGSSSQEGHSKLNKEGGQKIVQGTNDDLEFKLMIKPWDNSKQGEKKLNIDAKWHQFNGAVVDGKQVCIEFPKWNAFERGLFKLSPRIDFINTSINTIHEKNILKSFMVLKLLGVKLCEYPVERLELPEDYSKVNELLHFLVTLSDKDGFVTDKMRGRYEHSLTLSEIVEGVEESVRYKIVDPKDKWFVVAGCIDLQ